MNIKHQQDIVRKLKTLNHAKKIGSIAKTCRYFGICRSKEEAGPVGGLL